MHECGTSIFQNQLFVPNKEEPKGKILEVTNNTHYSMNPGGTKMYKDLRLYFWWDNMKKENCRECRQMFDLPKS